MTDDDGDDDDDDGDDDDHGDDGYNDDDGDSDGDDDEDADGDDDDDDNDDDDDDSDSDGDVRFGCFRLCVKSGQERRGRSLLGHPAEKLGSGPSSPHLRTPPPLRRCSGKRPVV